MLLQSSPAGDALISSENAAALSKSDAPSFTGLVGNNIDSDFTQKAGSFLAETTTQGADAASKAFGFNLPNSQNLSAQDINSQAPIGNDGKQVHITDEPMPANVAQMILNDKKRQLVNENMNARYENANGIVGTAVAGLASTLADPASLAAMSYGGAILGGGKALAGLEAGFGIDATTAAARTGARVISGAAGGAASMVPLAGAQYGISQYQGGDYDVKSALSDMAFGAVGGALIHGGFGSALHERGILKPDELMRAQTLKTDFQAQAADILRQPAPVKAAAMNSTIADVVNGRPADPSAVIGKDGQPPNLSQIANDRKQQNQNGYSPNMTPEEMTAARKTILPNGLKVEPQPSRLPDDEINRYKGTVQTALQNARVENVDDIVVQEIARIRAEQINPENAVKPRPLAEVQKEVPKQNAVAVETAPKPVEVEPPAAAANIEPPQSVFTSLAPTKKLQYDHLTAVRKAMVAKGIDASRMRIADRQLTVDNPTHAESMHIRDAVQAKHDKYLENSAKGTANYQKRMNNAAGKDPTTFKNFLTYLADHKGIQDGGGKEKISNLGLGKDVPVGLVRSDGMTHEAALKMAVKDRWISDKGSDNELEDLYDLIRDRGKQPHPEADAKQVSAQDHSDNLRHEMDKRSLHYDENTTDEDAEKILNAHRSLEKLGMNADGMSLKQMHDAMEMQSTEITDEHSALDHLDDEAEIMHGKYSPEGEQDHANESIPLSAYEGHESEVGAGDERPGLETGNEGGVRETEPIDAGVSGRGAEGAGADAGRAGTDDTEAAGGDVISKGDLYKLPRESLEQMRDETQLSDHEKLIKALGSDEEAKRFNRLVRQSESMDHARADKASKELGEIEDKLTPEQQKLIYGIGETGATKEDLDELIKAHSDITFTPHDDIKDIGYIGTLGIRKMLPEEILSVKEGRASIAAQAALIRFKGAFDELRDRGLTTEESLKAMAQGMSEKSGMGIGDATDFVRDFANAVKERSVEKPTFEPVKNVAGATEQGVLGGMEQSAKQAAAARGEKISAKVEQKPANEGLFQSVIGGGDELDLRIADAEKTINSSGMTVEERADLQQAYKEAAEADKIYSDKMKELGQCLGENGVA